MKTCPWCNAKHNLPGTTVYNCAECGEANRQISHVRLKFVISDNGDGFYSEGLIKNFIDKFRAQR